MMVVCSKFRDNKRREEEYEGPITNISIKTIHCRIWITAIEMVNVISTLSYKYNMVNRCYTSYFDLKYNLLSLALKNIHSHILSLI